MDNIFEKQLEQVAQELVLLDYTDMTALAALHTMFTDIGGTAGELSLPEVDRAVGKATGLIESLILEEITDFDECFDVIGRIVSAVQAVVRDGRSVEQAGFPSEINIAGEKRLDLLSVQENADTRTPLSEKTTEEEQPAAVILQGDTGLLADFVTEAMEHLETSDVQLLGLEMNPRDMEALNAVFRAFHTIKGVAGFLELKAIESLAHEAENLLDKARKKELVLAGEVIDVTFVATDMMKQLVEDLRRALNTGEPMIGRKSLSGLLNRIKAASIGNAQAIEYDAAPAAVAEEDSSAPERPAAAMGSHRVREIVKVDAERLDRLVDTIGELVIAESMVSQSSDLRDSSSPELSRLLKRLDKITRELQEMGTSLRMVPVRATFQKMARLVRDLSKKFGKSIEFVMAGEDTELDKSVVDLIGDPLVHIVRNSIDHGIESNIEERKKAGKPERGRVELRAFHKGGNIFIEVQDDGRGLDREAILAKARERGLVAEGESLSDRDTYNLIFAPGFSTAKQVTAVSGRGVGMDVVRRNIEKLRGQVDIQSTPGKGSIFSIRLPLTLAIIDGMVVRVGDERYIIPTLSITRSVRPTAEDIFTVLNRGEMLTLQGELVPLFRLDRLFNISEAEQDPARALVVVVEDDGRRTGLLTDELLGQQQIVIKPLGESFRDVAGLSGGAIMPDGQVGLILDVGGLVKMANTDGGSDNKDEHVNDQAA